MKKIIYTTLIFILSLQIKNGFAQKEAFDLKLSNGMEEPKNSTIIDVIGKGTDAYYCIRMQTKTLSKASVFIEKYNKEPDLAASQEIELVGGGEDLTYAFTALCNERLYVFGSYFDKKEDKETLYAFEVNPSTLAVSHTAKKVATALSKRNSTFIYNVSDNQKYLAILAVPGYDKKEPQNPTVSVYSGDMEQIWSKEVEADVQSDLISLVSMEVSNTGDAHLLARAYIDEKKFLSRSYTDYELMMISYTDMGKDQSKFKLEIGDKKITDVSFKVNDDGTLSCGGFYTEAKKSTGGYKGVCFFMLDPVKSEIMKQGSKEFSTEELSEFMKSRQAEKGREIELFDLGDLVLREDGGLVMVAEKYYVVVTTYHQGSVTYTRTTYYYLELLVVNVSPDLEIEWMKAVPKRQITNGDDGLYSSYALFVHGDKIYLLFNDNDENLNADTGDKLKNYDGKKSVVMLATIDGDGKMKKEIVLQNKTAGIILRPKICEQVSDEQMFIYGELKKLYRVGFITFEE